jgi:ankyrin repeat protein
MDKFREKYKLHNKYRQSKSKSATRTANAGTNGGSNSTPSKESKGVTMIGEKSKLYASTSTSMSASASASASASSSVTISTASISFDSGDTKSSAASDAKTGGGGRTNHSLRHKNSAYQPLGNVSGGGSVSNGTAQNQISNQRHNRYHALPRSAEDEQSHQKWKTDNGARTKENGNDSEIASRTNTIGIGAGEQSQQQPRQQREPQRQRQQPQHDLASTDCENDTPTHQNKNLELAPSRPIHTPRISTPARKNTTTNTIIAKTPPRTAQTHTSVHMVPTEAQLRWAQFHQKKRAAQTRERIQKLMTYPLHVQHVKCAENGDGDPFSSDESEGTDVSKTKGVKRNERFVLSRGRRALLRVSERRMKKRRVYIKENGFVMTPVDEELSSSEEEDEGSSSHDQSVTRTIDESLVFDEIAEALHAGDSSISEDNPANAIHAKPSTRSKDTMSGLTSSKKKKRSSKKKMIGGRRLKGVMRTMDLTADEDEERMQRFEEAYTLMCSVKKKSGTNNVIKASKIWSRSSKIASAISIDGRVYADLQRSPSIKHTPPSKLYGTEIVGAELNGVHLTDRGASWMMHLPKQDRGRPVKFFGHNYQPNANGEDRGAASFISPSKKKLMEIVDRIQVSKPATIQESPHSRTQSTHAHDRASIPKKLQDHPSVGSSHSNTIEDDGSRTINPKITSQKLKGRINVASIGDKLSQGLDSQEVDNQDGSTYTDGDSDLIYEQKIQKIAAQMKSNNSVIDTDNHSDISDGVDAFQEARTGILMMSPTIISKRLNQAIETIQLGRWEQVGYLILANPWLAEMNDVSNQYLLHKLALYGGGTIGVVEEYCEPAPKKLNADLIKASSAAIHKFDTLGNLPLHCAAEAGNKEMVSRLAKIFPGGSSVRNNDGQLPLHLAILACGNEKIKAPVSLVSKILALFPAALSIADNDDNLPLHLAAAFLTGDAGAEVIHLLVDEAEKQGENLRFSSAVKSLENVDDIMSNDDANDQEDLSILSIKNTLGWNPLVTAIQMSAGYQVLDALLSRSEVDTIAFATNEFGQTILHQSIVREICDPPSIISILKAFPDLVRFRDENGALPIEVACMRDLDPGVIFAIALLDLPIDPDSENVEIRDGFGGSWSYLNCDCDDNYVHIIKELLDLCDDYRQKRTLCFLKDKQGKSIMSRATPKCKRELRKTLRFDGRYEFIGGAKAMKILGEEVKVFEALDFGSDEEPRDEGRKVSIKYYWNKDAFTRAVSKLSHRHIIHTIQISSLALSYYLYRRNLYEESNLMISNLLTPDSLRPTQSKAN